MNGKKNCLTRKEAFRLARLVAEWKSKGLDRFRSWSAAEEYFTRALGSVVTRYTLDKVCDDSGIVVDDVVEITRRGPVVTEDASRLESIERRLSALESIVSQLNGGNNV